MVRGRGRPLVFCFDLLVRGRGAGVRGRLLVLCLFFLLAVCLRRDWPPRVHHASWHSESLSRSTSRRPKNRRHWQCLRDTAGPPKEERPGSFFRGAKKEKLPPIRGSAQKANFWSLLAPATYTTTPLIILRRRCGGVGTLIETMKVGLPARLPTAVTTPPDSMLDARSSQVRRRTNGCISQSAVSRTGIFETILQLF